MYTLSQPSAICMMHSVSKLSFVWSPAHGDNSGVDNSYTQEAFKVCPDVGCVCWQCFRCCSLSHVGVQLNFIDKIHADTGGLLPLFLHRCCTTSELTVLDAAGWKTRSRLRLSHTDRSETAMRVLSDTSRRLHCLSLTCPSSVC